MKRLEIWFVAFLFLVNACGGPDQEKPGNQVYEQTKAVDSLDIALQKRYDEGAIPGFAVSVFSHDRVYYQRGFGYADVEAQKPYTPATIQMIASVSKTTIGVALMQLVEAGQLDLDEDINSYLSFGVRNPLFPEDPITLRQLAMHTSGINDSVHYNRTYLFESELNKHDFDTAWHELIETYNDNESMDMEVFLEKILSDDGDWYTPANFYRKRPGTTYNYSNLGASLLATVIGEVSGKGFDIYTREQLFGPISLSNTTWALSEDQRTRETVYYHGNMEPFPRYRIITYPDGGLYSTVKDLTVFLQEVMQSYTGESGLLEQASVETMWQQQGDVPDGLCWDLSIPCCVGHAGNDFGTSTLLYYEPDTGVGRILFANLSLEKEAQEAAFYGVFNDLFAYDLR